MFEDPLRFSLVLVLVFLVVVVLLVSVGGAICERTILLLPFFRFVAEVGMEEEPNDLFKRVWGLS